MPKPRYTLRVSVKVQGKEPITGLEAEPSILAGPITVSFKQRWPYLIILAQCFDSEFDAEGFLSQIKGGLWNLAIQRNIAFSPYFQRRSIVRSDNPEKAAHNLARTFGLSIEEPVVPVHGLTEEEGYVIYESGENIRFLSSGEINAFVSSGWESVKEALTEGICKSRIQDDGQDAALVTAIDLYLASFYETSIRARFLTLMMCLEVLAPKTLKHPAVISALSELATQVRDKLARVSDQDERSAFESLLSEINFKNETSISRRLRALVLEQAPMAEGAKQELADKIVKAYNLRSSLVHTGTVDVDKLHGAVEITLETVKLLLRAHLGLSEHTPLISEQEC